jgi:WD40 repeat protein
MRKTIKALFIVTIISFYSCENKDETTALKQIAELPKGLKEISGIAYANNLLYAIEDSGNPNEVVVVDTLGKITKNISVSNVENIDWEDLTFDNKGNLYIGDFGNNDNVRKDLAIYKISQSDLKGEKVDVAYRITFNYPEQTSFPPKKKELLFDVEAFFEYNNHFYLFTKNRSRGFDGTSYIYKIPNTSGHHQAKLIKKIKTCGDYHNCAITSAAISPDGSKFVLLSHSKVWLFEDYSQVDITTGRMTELDIKHYSQKEAICFKNNKELFIADERVKKVGGNIYQADLNSLNN